MCKEWSCSVIDVDEVDWWSVTGNPLHFSSHDVICLIYSVGLQSQKPHSGSSHNTNAVTFLRSSCPMFQRFSGPVSSKFYIFIVSSPSLLLISDSSTVITSFSSIINFQQDVPLRTNLTMRENNLSFHKNIQTPRVTLHSLPSLSFWMIRLIQPLSTDILDCCSLHDSS